MEFLIHLFYFISAHRFAGSGHLVARNRFGSNLYQGARIKDLRALLFAFSLSMFFAEPVLPVGCKATNPDFRGSPFVDRWRFQTL
jgi:hypothetical protein